MDNHGIGCWKKCDLYCLVSAIEALFITSIGMSSLASKESDAIKCILEAIDRERERVMSIKTVSKARARSSAHQSVSR